MKLQKNIIANYFGQFYSIMIGIIMLPFYLKYLGAEAYGLVGFFALMQSWMLLLDIGISPTLSREVSKVKASHNSKRNYEFKFLLHSLEFIFIVFSVIIFLIIFFFSDWISIHWLKVETLDLNTVAFSISLMGFMLGLRLLSGLYKSGIVGAEEQVWLNIANVIVFTLKFVGVFFILKYISSDVKYFFIYQLIVAILEFLVFTIKFYKIMNIGRFKIYFSYAIVKPILPFAMSVAYTGGVWVFLTQFDKLLLSSILPLSEYGYFTLVVMVANAVLQLMNPIGQALQPRIINLIHKNKMDEMIKIYKQSTQLMAIIVFSVVAIVAFYPYELLYSWTGDIQASLWGKDILTWYVIGNGILAMTSFQYTLQFAYGNLKLHVWYNTILAVISIPLIYFVAYHSGAIGVAIVWAIIRFISFVFWTPYIHHKFIPGVHKNWILKDILPVFMSTTGFIILINYIDFSFDYSRGVIFSILLLVGLCLLMLNSFVAREGRTMIINLIKSRKN